MSNWKSKSESTIEASTILIGKSLLNQSVHCSYYSCVQYAFHIMCDYLGMDVDWIEKQSLGSVNKIGTHKWLRNEIYKSLRQRDIDAADEFNTAMGILCDARVIADYKHEIIMGNRAYGLNSKAIKIIGLLKEIYG